MAIGESMITLAWYQQLDTVAQQENAFSPRWVVADIDCRVHNASTNGIKRDAEGARTTRRKDCVRAVFDSYQEASHWLQSRDMDLLLCVIRDSDLERFANSITTNISEIEEGRRDLDP